MLALFHFHSLFLVQHSHSVCKSIKLNTHFTFDAVKSPDGSNHFKLMFLNSGAQMLPRRMFEIFTWKKKQHASRAHVAHHHVSNELSKTIKTSHNFSDGNFICFSYLTVKLRTQRDLWNASIGILLTEAAQQSTECIHVANTGISTNNTLILSSFTYHLLYSAN